MVKSKLEKYKKVNVLDAQQLRDLGYNPMVYYCGNHRMEHWYTKVRDKLDKYFKIPFPYNPACFKHDVLYGELFVNSDFGFWKTLKEKIEIDFIFYADMDDLIQAYTSSRWHSHLRARQRVYLSIVILFTPVYIIGAKLQKRWKSNSKTAK
jgi:hypothetical protein